MLLNSLKILKYLKKNTEFKILLIKPGVVAAIHVMGVRGDPCGAMRWTAISPKTSINVYHITRCHLGRRFLSPAGNIEYYNETFKREILFLVKNPRVWYFISCTTSVFPKNVINPIIFIKNEAPNIGLLSKIVLW